MSIKRFKIQISIKSVLLDISCFYWKFSLILQYFSEFGHFKIIHPISGNFVTEFHSYFHFPAVNAPPSIGSKQPVMNEADSLVRYSIAALVSETSPTRPTG